MDTTFRALRRLRASGRHRPAGRGIRALALLAALATTAALSACGEYSPVDAAGSAPTASSGAASPTASPSPSPSESPGGGGGGAGGGGGGVEPASYTWELPPTDTSVSDNDGPAYNTLMNGCDGAAQYLVATADQKSYGFSNPRFAVIFAAGIALCRGDTGAAAHLLSRAVSIYGTSGIDRPGEPNKPGTSTEPVDPPRPPGYGEPECDIYRTLRSVIEQVSPETIACPGGARPAHVTRLYPTNGGFEVEVWDDPLTFDVDESLIPPEDAVIAPSPSPTDVQPVDEQTAPPATQSPAPPTSEPSPSG